MCRYVQYRKEELGMAMRETFVPETYDWGQEAQVDWYETFAEVLGERSKVYVFSMRSMARWRAAEHFITLTTTPRSRHFWKRTSSRFATLPECFSLRRGTLRAPRASRNSLNRTRSCQTRLMTDRVRLRFGVELPNLRFSPISNRAKKQIRSDVIVPQKWRLRFIPKGSTSGR